MKLIPIVNKTFEILDHAKVDDDIFDTLSKHKWVFCGEYAATFVRKTADWRDGYKVEYMHRMVTDCPKDLEVDHKNHDKLDNRRENLENCTRSKNHMNRKCQRPATGY